MQWLNVFFLFVIVATSAAFPQVGFGFRQQFPNQFGGGDFGQQFPNQFGAFGQSPNQFGAGAGQQQNFNQFGAGQQNPNQFGAGQQNPNQFGGGFGQQQPQSPNQFGQQQQNPTSLTNPTTPAPASTTPGPEFYRCVDQCPTLSQYSPICASDGTAYHNDQKLQCANQCGRRLNPNWQEIVALRSGSCTPGGRPFVPSPIV